LFRARPHARLQPGPTRGQQHLRADPNLKILDRNLAEKPRRTVKQADQWKQQLLKKKIVLEPKKTTKIKFEKF